MRTNIAKTVFALALIGVTLSGAASYVLAEEENEKLPDETKGYKFKTVTTQEGLNFSVPEDMPIVTRNGIKAPLPFEEYLYMKFKELEEKMNVIEKKIDDLREVFASTKAKEAAKEQSLQEKAGLLSST